MFDSRALRGHYWTLRGFVGARLRPTPIPPTSAWSTLIDDPLLGSVRLTGRLRARRDSSWLLVIVHGLGGSSQSAYTLAASAAAEAANMASLRLNLRGADRLGEDLFHAGLGNDIGAALASPELARYPNVALLGYSLGGHVCLRYAIDHPDSRLRSVAAICPPLDLDAAASAFDRPTHSVYRWHVMNGLKHMFLSFHERRGPTIPTPLSEVLAIEHIRQWDEMVVAQRHGFASASDYYAQSSVAPKLGQLRIPSLLVHSLLDPMVPASTVAPWYERISPAVEWVRLDAGGHIAFPASFGLSVAGQAGLAPQTVAWLRARGAAHDA